MSFGVPSDAGMEGPQRRRHDGAQRRKILIMGPSAAGMTGPQRRGGAPAGVELAGIQIKETAGEGERAPGASTAFRAP